MCYINFFFISMYTLLYTGGAPSSPHTMTTFPHKIIQKKNTYIVWYVVTQNIYFFYKTHRKKYTLYCSVFCCIRRYVLYMPGHWTALVAIFIFGNIKHNSFVLYIYSLKGGYYFLTFDDSYNAYPIPIELWMVWYEILY